MTVLLDTGPIVALLDHRQPNHEQCREVIEALTDTIITCEAVITGACYLLRRLRGAAGDLLVDVEARRFVIDYRACERAGQVRRLMARYANVPMDFADACLVDLAGLHQTGQILTLDADFRIYRWGRNRPFELLLNV